MAAPLGDESKLRMALDSFTHFGCRPGDALLRRDFFAVATRRDWLMVDIERGIAIGGELEYFERGDDNSVRLTEKGFTAL